jgi:hypothetical protein
VEFPIWNAGYWWTKVPFLIDASVTYNWRVLTDDDKKWVTEHLERLEERFSEKIEKLETTLLTEFHKWASPLEMRQKSHAAAIRALDAEIESLSDRLKNVEGRQSTS